MTPPAEAGPWTLPHRIAFRFLFVYFVVAFPSAILQLVPVVGGLGDFLEMAIRPFYVWVGKVAFGLEITVFPNGSGDTTFNWIQAGTNLGIAMLATGIRSVAELLQQYGDSSPMGLMWTFMRASPAYVMFAGWMETIGGLLLLFRRTQLLGAMLVAGVMANVFVLNMCYDVPVEPADLVGPWTSAIARRVAIGVKFAWITVTGTVAGATIDATCTRLRPTDYLLINRGFRWINETPYNR